LTISVEVTNNKEQEITETRELNGLEAEISGGEGGKFVTRDGELFIEAVADDVAPNRAGNLIVSVSTPTHNFSHKVFDVRPNPQGTVVVGLDSDVSTSVLKGERVNIENKDIRVEDQYGREMSEEAKAGLKIVA